MAGCQGCGVKPCHHCQSVADFTDVNFRIGKVPVDYRAQRKQYNLLEAYFNEHHKETLREELCSEDGEY